MYVCAFTCIRSWLCHVVMSCIYLQVSGFKTSVYQGVLEIILNEDALVSIEDETEVDRGCSHFNENH